MSQNNSSPRTDTRMQTLAQIGLAVVAALVLALRFPDLARTIFAFVVILSVLIFVHEWGHFQFARWAGMKVNRFAIGFPPFILNKEKDGVIYSIGALPIGGLVDISGLGSEEEMVNSAKGENVSPVVRDTNRPWGQKQFQDGSLFQRFMVLFAGPLMNFIFAILLAIFLFSVLGVVAPGYKDNYIGNVTPNSPAEKAGVQAGDRLIGVNALRSEEWAKLAEAIQNSKGNSLTLLLKRDGREVSIPVKPSVEEVPQFDGTVKKMPIVGIMSAPDPQTVTYQRTGIGEAVQRSFSGAYFMAAGIFGTISRAATGNLTKMERDSIGGPVKIAQITGQVAKEGDIRRLLELSAALSINLGLLNLLPLPALDGGRISFLGYELIMRRPAPPRIETIVHATGMVMLLAFMLFITYRDIAPWLRTTFNLPL